MSRQHPFRLFLSGIFALLPTYAAAQLHSVDEALSASKKTGRPIFAMAGQKT
jgi:hypothetical protein